VLVNETKHLESIPGQTAGHPSFGEGESSSGGFVVMIKVVMRETETAKVINIGSKTLLLASTMCRHQEPV
jgi:hypothetical protein